jgi:hypothetical protein
MPAARNAPPPTALAHFGGGCALSPHHPFLSPATNHHHPRQRPDSARPNSRLGSGKRDRARWSRRGGKKKQKQKKQSRTRDSPCKTGTTTGTEMIETAGSPPPTSLPFRARPPRRIRSPLGRTREGCQPAAGTGWVLPLTVLDCIFCPQFHSTYLHSTYACNIRARMRASSCGDAIALLCFDLVSRPAPLLSLSMQIGCFPFPLTPESRCFPLDVNVNVNVNCNIDINAMPLNT